VARTPNSSRVLGGFVLAATAVLAVLSRGKWSDALIDSGREWIVPDALARGQLLYRDVVYWFGLLTPYVHGALFRLFGSSFSTLVLAGSLSAVAALAALYAALTRVTERTAAALWTALAIPALVFMPNAGGAILGMGYRIWHAATLSLLAILVVSAESRGLRRIAAAGALCALAGLCRLRTRSRFRPAGMSFDRSHPCWQASWRCSAPAGFLFSRGPAGDRFSSSSPCSS
jgi:hypothetical protein